MTVVGMVVVFLSFASMFSLCRGTCIAIGADDVCADDGCFFADLMLSSGEPLAGTKVGVSVGFCVGATVGVRVGEDVGGDELGWAVGVKVGIGDGVRVDGSYVGVSVGVCDGTTVGTRVGDTEGKAVGARVRLGWLEGKGVLGSMVGKVVGTRVGSNVGSCVGVSVGESVGIKLFGLMGAEVSTGPAATGLVVAADSLVVPPCTTFTLMDPSVPALT